MARSVVATDNFNRADGALGANWARGASSYTDNDPVILSNQVKSGGEGTYDNFAYYSGASFNNDQYSKITLSTVPSGDSYAGVVVRAGTGTTDLAFAQYVASATNKTKITWFHSGTYTVIAQNTGTWTSGDTMALEVVGNDYSLYKNDSLVLSGTSSSPPATGKAGFSMYDGDERSDNWEGGNIVSSTNDSSSRPFKTTGKDTANSNRPFKITGKDSANDGRGFKTTGADSANSNRGFKTTGNLSDSNNRSFKVTGSDSANDSRPMKVTGADSSADARAFKLTGVDSITDNRAFKLTGVDASSLYTLDETANDNDLINVGGIKVAGAFADDLTLKDISSYDNTANSDVNGSIYSAYSGDGQSVRVGVVGYKAYSAQFYLKKTGSPTGNMVAKIYAHSGTFGTSSVPTGTALATSDAIDVSTLTGTLQMISFYFTGANAITLTNGTDYFVAIEYSGGDVSNNVNIGIDQTSPTHNGNRAYKDGVTWTPISTQDAIFNLTGSLISSSSARSSYAVDLDGASYLYIADADQTGLDINTDFSIEAWVKLSTLPSTIGTGFSILAKSDVADISTRSYELSINASNKLVVFFSDGSTHTRFEMTEAFDADDIGEWIHLAVTVDISAPTAVMYKDGVSKAYSTPSSSATTIATNAQDFIVGARRTTTLESFFYGSIDELRVWNDIRSESEITDNKGIELVGNEAGLVAYYKFELDTDDSSNRNFKLTGTDSANDSRGFKLTGTLDADDSRAFKLTGTDVLDDSRAFKLTGTDSASSQRGFRMRGIIGWTKQVKPTLPTWTKTEKPDVLIWTKEDKPDAPTWTKQPKLGAY